MDPIMEEVLNVIQARGYLAPEEIDQYKSADNDEDLQGLYEEFIAPAITDVERRIESVSSTVESLVYNPALADAESAKVQDALDAAEGEGRR